MPKNRLLGVFFSFYFFCVFKVIICNLARFGGLENVPREYEFAVFQQQIEPVYFFEKCGQGKVVGVCKCAKRENGWLPFSAFDLRDELPCDVRDDGKPILRKPALVAAGQENETDCFLDSAVVVFHFSMWI